MAKFQDTSGNYFEYSPSSPYGQTQGFIDAMGKNLHLQSGSGEFNPVKAEQELSGYANTFNNLFRQLVGRDANTDEVGQFYQQVVAPQGSFPGGGYAGQQELRDRTATFVSDNFQRAAEEQAKQELAGQQGEATRLADLFRTQGNQAISSTEQSLLNFREKLFNKLRPNLITSLQAQGLLNSGGLNQAFAGAASDLSDASEGALMDARLQNEQQANAIQFAGQSAPLEFARGQSMGRLNNINQFGQNAMQQAFAQRSNELNFMNQMALQNNMARIQREAQPSFLRTFGQTAASSLGSNFNFPNWISSVRGGAQSSTPGAVN